MFFIHIIRRVSYENLPNAQFWLGGMQFLTGFQLNLYIYIYTHTHTSELVYNDIQFIIIKYIKYKQVFLKKHRIHINLNNKYAKI